MAFKSTNGNDSGGVLRRLQKIKEKKKGGEQNGKKKRSFCSIASAAFVPGQVTPILLFLLRQKADPAVRGRRLPDLLSGRAAYKTH